MKTSLYLKISILVAGILIIGGAMGKAIMADEHHSRQRHHIENEDQDRAHSRQKDDEGNETAGQMAAWLLAAANLTVVLSLLIKWINRFKSLDSGIKTALLKFNRSQKKLLMPIHYWLNPLVFIILLWHWGASCCRSTALPEWGFIILVIIMGIGILLKFKLSPKFLRKGIYQIHTQPYALIALVTLVTIGHFLMD